MNVCGGFVRCKHLTNIRGSGVVNLSLGGTGEGSGGHRNPEIVNRKTLSKSRL